MKSLANLSQRTWWIIGGACVVFAALLPLLNISIPGVLPGATYTPGTLQLLALALLFASLALSYHILFGTAGMLSFGHALYFALGAYGLGIVLQQTELTLIPALGLTLAIVIAAAYLLGSLSLRVTGISFAMVTLAFAQAGNVLVRRNPSVTGGEEGLRLDTEHIPDFFIGVVNTRNLYWLALALLVIVFVIVAWFENSRAGHAVTATRENELRVRVLGLRPFGVKLTAFVIASVLASLVGMVHLLLQSGTHDPCNCGARGCWLTLGCCRWRDRLHAARSTAYRPCSIRCDRRTSGYSPYSPLRAAVYPRYAVYPCGVVPSRRNRWRGAAPRNRHQRHATCS
jgi:branched-chain amino acid transport system permease protein